MLSAATANPFYQASSYFIARFFIHKDHVALIEETFGDLAVSVSSFELSEQTGEWKTELVVDGQAAIDEIHTRTVILSEVMGVSVRQPEIEHLEQKDWVSEINHLFPPLHIGRFFVHGSHHKEGFPKSSIPLHIDAGAAFGSGEHGTTSGCLLALEYLHKRTSPRSALDMGCGSGILAIAFAKLMHRHALAIDLDPVSVSVTRENAHINQVQHWVKAYAQDGYSGSIVKRSKPFDLVFANILARPLMKMAPKLRRALKPGGYAILSGLLIDQEAMVLAAHRIQKLYLVKRWHREGWSTLLLQRRN